MKSNNIEILAVVMKSKKWSNIGPDGFSERERLISKPSSTAQNFFCAWLVATDKPFATSSYFFVSSECCKAGQWKCGMFRSNNLI